MKILMVNYEYPPLGGGGGVAAANLAREFVRLGHHVDYVTTHYCGMARQEVIEGVGLYREPVLGRKDLHTATIISMLAYPAVAIRRSLALGRRVRYDLVHTHFAIPSGPGGLALSRWWKIPNVLSVYGGDIYDPSKPYSPHRHPLLKRVVRRVLNQAALVIPESRDLCERTVQIYGTRTPLCCIPLGFVPHPCERPSRAELGLAEERLYAIAVSRLIPRKAYGDLLRAFALAAVENLELLIVGDGPEETGMRALAAELGIASKVRFLGYLGEADKFRYLGVADFFALSPLHEGFGIVFQEAMASGLPIVTTNAGGQVDFLAEGRNALLSPPREPEALARSIAEMAARQELRQRMREHNLMDIRGHFIDTVASRYLEAFARVLRGREAV